MLDKEVVLLISQFNIMEPIKENYPSAMIPWFNGIKQELSLNLSTQQSMIS